MFFVSNRTISLKFEIYIKGPAQAKGIDKDFLIG